MITRIELDGFKSFSEFTLDVPPFLLLVGANASGKSNVVDALRLVAEAFELRKPAAAMSGFDRGQGFALFRRDGSGRRAEHMSLVLTADDPGTVKSWRMTADWREREELEGALVPGHESFGVRLQVLAGEPRAMSRPAAGGNREPLAADGANLAAVLGRLAENGRLGALQLDASVLIPALDGIVPVRNHRGDWDFDLVFRGTGPMPPALASDGTLRVVALLAALHDVDHPGTVVIDELETGLHPARLKALVSIAHRLVAESRGADGSYGRQLIATTHSPVALAQALALAGSSEDTGVVFLDTVLKPETRDGETVMSPVTWPRRVAPGGGPRGEVVTPAEVRAFLDSVRAEDW